MENKNAYFSLFMKASVVAVWIFLIFSAIFFFSSSPEKTVSQNRTLNIFSWSGIIHPEILEEFEKKHHIKVNIDYFSSNEELIVKLKATKGLGYDLIIQSDYATQILISENLLKPLDKSRLTFLSTLDPFLLNHSFDPGNTYSIPVEWDLCGFGIDSKNDVSNQNSLSWNDLFDTNQSSHRIAMSNDPVEAFCMASFYLFGAKTALTPSEALKVTELLKEQKQKVEAYAVPRSDYLLASKNASLAVALNGFIMQAKKDFPNLEFVIPDKATFLSIENVTLSKHSNNDDISYKFLNFLYTNDRLAKCSNTYGFLPVTECAAESFIFKNDYDKIKSRISEEDYNIYFFRHLIPEEELRKLWVRVKS